MNTRLRPRLHSRNLALLAGAVVLLSGSDTFARDYIRIPLPPPPREVFENVKNFFHRIGTKVGDTVRRLPWVNDDDDKDEPKTRSKGKSAPARKPSWDGAKKEVPYRYNDADEFEARSKSSPPAETKAANPSRGDAPPVTITGPKPLGEEPAVTKTPGPSAPSLPVDPEKTQPPVTKAAEPSNLPFGSPVSGKRGLVYPPGAKHTPENMVDVTDFKSGQIVRDPRTGELFRVP